MMSCDCSPLNIDHEADATGIVFVSRIVETLLNRESDHAEYISTRAVEQY